MWDILSIQVQTIHPRTVATGRSLLPRGFLRVPPHPLGFCLNLDFQDFVIFRISVLCGLMLFTRKPKRTQKYLDVGNPLHLVILYFLVQTIHPRTVATGRSLLPRGFLRVPPHPLGFCLNLDFQDFVIFRISVLCGLMLFTRKPKRTQKYLDVGNPLHLVILYFLVQTIHPRTVATGRSLLPRGLLRVPPHPLGFCLNLDFQDFVIFRISVLCGLMLFTRKPKRTQKYLDVGNPLHLVILSIQVQTIHPRTVATGRSLLPRGLLRVPPHPLGFCLNQDFQDFVIFRISVLCGLMLFTRKPKRTQKYLDVGNPLHLVILSIQVQTIHPRTVATGRSLLPRGFLRVPPHPLGFCLNLDFQDFVIFRISVLCGLMLFTRKPKRTQKIPGCGKSSPSGNPVLPGSDNTPVDSRDREVAPTKRASPRPPHPLGFCLNLDFQDFVIFRISVLCGLMLFTRKPKPTQKYLDVGNLVHPGSDNTPADSRDREVAPTKRVSPRASASSGILSEPGFSGFTDYQDFSHLCFLVCVILTFG